LFFADEFVRSFNQRNEDVKRATPKPNWLIPVEQEPLGRQQAKRAE
jgi:hypothetical protein